MKHPSFNDIAFSEKMSESKGGSGKLRCSKMQVTLDMYKDDLKSKLGELSGDGNLADDILPLWCCISDKYDWNIDTTDSCHLLYYTVGSIIYKQLKNEESFDSIMEGVHQSLGSMLSAGKCKDVPIDNGKKLFKLMKKLSDYNLSPKDMWQEEKSSGRVSCSRCTNYLGKIAETCTKVKTFCGSTQNQTDCAEIEMDDGDERSPGYVAQLIYSIIPEPRSTAELDGDSEAQTSSSESEGANSSGNIINNISYGLLTVSSVLVTFFFYKYISLFFSFPRRKSSNGRSGRSNRWEGRGRFVSHNLDNRTEDIGTGTEYDSSTEYYTENSTVADYASTVEDSTEGSTIDSTTLYSALYTTRSKKKGSSEHQQRKYRNNIAYHRM
ncbi:KIR protein [Plasmodium knowlesi strain H]|uniref:KIR protein n=3 Tax=Plasmodium knowlesi TaxID=5850 RepID=A0A5K1ULQ9_PLAKH|nr:KIR protein [Plasmodium knowlesi strain H]OTN66167.1 KIR protein [Plasmodium knowlesi]CAA9989896.1 KIR protein [Plasmodium knowlesi strain H]SBO24460.1 KIR protein [Plasmodium knowlesi strain H]SBO26533.1 KIR protein [Plasmodium knowlesi strain H]VVS79370.1 KIR protein [Plasmodium knowlesi strain H]|eukprot:XP_002259912.1 KIR protein [Plasmodium knowlesi strain H]